MMKGLSTISFKTSLWFWMLMFQSTSLCFADTPTTQSVEVDYRWAFIRTAITLMLTLILIVAVIYFARRFSLNRIYALNTERHIKVIESRPLSPKTMLHLVEAAGKRTIIAESHVEIKTILNLDESS